MSKYWMNKQDDISLEWWNTLKYEVRNKLSMKYFDKNDPISLVEIKEIWFKEKDNWLKL